MTIVVTGATGFIGAALVHKLLADKRTVRPCIRGVASEVIQFSRTCFSVGELCGETDWTNALNGASVVVHTAARVHVMNDSSENESLGKFRRINVDGTLNLAKQAANNGVRRFVFLSSIKVNGEFTLRENAFTAEHLPNPQDAYGTSKLEAEIGLRHIARETGMDVVIIRPTLVYGPGVKANFAALSRCVVLGIPLPFGLIVNNRRSFLALDNLIDLITTCIDHPAAANQTFLASDGYDLSTKELVQRLGDAIGKRPTLIPVPLTILQFLANLAGKGDVAQRLLGSLQVDISKTKDVLGWTPPITIDQGFDLVMRGLPK